MAFARDPRNNAPLNIPLSDEAFLARVKAESFFADPTDSRQLTELRKKPKRVHKRVKQAEALDETQRRMLLDLLEGRRVLASVDGESYGVARDSTGWSVCSLAPGATEHTVTADGNDCSCADRKFREHVCKHMSMVRKLL